MLNYSANTWFDNRRAIHHQRCPELFRQQPSQRERTRRSCICLLESCRLFRAQALLLVDLHLKGSFPMQCLIESTVVFPPKGEEPEDETYLKRQASNVRPLSLNHCDNMLICGISNHALRSLAFKSDPSIQRGFISNRRAGDNIIDFDAAACSYSTNSSPQQRKAPGFGDIAAAFHFCSTPPSDTYSERVGCPVDFAAF